jgi:hypothetical protein
LNDFTVGINELGVEPTTENPLRRPQTYKLCYVSKVTLKEPTYAATVRVEGLYLCFEVLVQPFITAVGELVIGGKGS